MLKSLNYLRCVSNCFWNGAVKLNLCTSVKGVSDSVAWYDGFRIWQSKRLLWPGKHTFPIIPHILNEMMGEQNQQVMSTSPNMEAKCQLLNLRSHECMVYGILSRTCNQLMIDVNLSETFSFQMFCSVSLWILSYSSI